MKESAARDGSRSPPESSGLAFDSAAVAFTASGQSIIDNGGASNAATTAAPEAVGGIAALDGEWCPELCAELCGELCAALDDELCPELCAALGDEPGAELSAAFSAGCAIELTLTFATCLPRFAQQPCDCIDAHVSAATTTLAVFSGEEALCVCAAAVAALNMLSQPNMQPPPAIQKATTNARVTRTIRIEERNLILPRSLAI